MIEILEQLCRIPTAFGMEKDVLDYIEAEFSKDLEILRDGMGNLTAVKRCGKENAKKIMLCASSDGVGFIANYIEENGYVRVTRLGSSSTISCAYTELVSEKGTSGFIVPEKGAEVKEGDASKLYLDIGASTRKEAEKLVRLGDVFAPVSSLKRLCKSRIGGSGVASRAPTALLLKLMRQEHFENADVYFTFTVQSTLRHRGAKTAAFDICPDVCICIDVCESFDTVGAENKGEACLSDGAVIIAKTSDFCTPPRLRTKITDIAEKIGAKYKVCVYSEKTSEASMLSVCGDGNVCAELCIPARNLGSSAEIFDASDFEDVYEIVVAVVSSELGL